MQLPVALRRLAFRLAYRLLTAYWFIRRPKLNGVKFLLTDGDSVLLVRHTYGPRAWEVPGGGIKRHEPPLHAALREMHEELGLDVEDVIMLNRLTVRMNHRSGTLHCFQARVHSPPIELNLGELADARWFQRSHLPTNVGRYVRQIVALSATPG